MPSDSRPAAAAPEADFRRWRQHGDAAALGRVFDRLAPELLLVAAHLAGRGNAEDLVQGTFVAAITDAARWQAERPLLPWLVGILANLARRERDRAGRRVDAARLHGNAPPDPRDVAEREETARLLADALQGMPRHYRHALTLRLVHGLEPLAIAHALGAPPATIKSRLQRGMAMLQRALPAGLRALAVTQLPLPLATLARTRDAVLAHARSHLVAGGLAGGAMLASGGMLMTKKIAPLAAVVLLTTAAAFTVPALWRPPAVAAPEQVAARVEPAAAPGPSAHEAPADPTPSRVVAVTSTPEPIAPAAPTVRGRVVDAGGAPLAAVDVYLGDKSNRMFESAARFLRHAAQGRADEQARDAKAQASRTGADGSFAFTPPAGDRPHLVVAFAPQRGCRAIDLPTDPAARLEIVLPIDPIFTGAVQGAADHRAVAAAAVNCWPERSGYPIEFRTTAADGTFRFVPLPPGAYRLSVQAEGFAERTATFQLTAGVAAERLLLELTALPAIDLLLVDPNGQAWTPARIGRERDAAAPEFVAMLSKRSYRRLEERLAETWDSHLLRLGDDGHLRGFRSVDAARVFSLWCAGEKLFEVADVAVDGDRLVATMLARATIALQVGIAFAVTADAPRTVHLAITDPAGFATRMRPIVARDTTAATCVLPVPAQFAGTDCGLSAECDGCAPFFTVVTVPAQADGIWQQVVLSPGSERLRGVVVDRDGKALANVQLQLADGDGRWFLPPNLARKGAELDGSFEFTGLPPRPARLLVAAPGVAPRGFDVDPRQHEPLRLVLRPGRELVVAVPAGVSSCCAVVHDGSGRLLQDDRLSGTKRYGKLSVTADLEAATVAVFDGASGQLVGDGPIPPAGATMPLTDRR